MGQSLGLICQCHSFSTVQESGESDSSKLNTSPKQELGLESRIMKEQEGDFASELLEFEHA